jgi:protein-S-isoprenylcysteine O-methyltransferase Ste14
MTANDVPGVVAPPPLIFLGFLLAGFVLEAFMPLPLRPAAIAQEISWIVSAALIVAGVAMMALGVRNFMRAATPVPTREPTRALVTTGIHGRMRNPLYLSMFLMYLGLGILANSIWILLLLVPLAFIIRYGVVSREEVYLERKFGDDYRAYKSRVRRWI